MKSMKEILEQAENIKVIGESNGSKLVSFDDQMAAAQQIMMEGRDIGSRDVKPDGTIARSKAPYLSVNLENYYINRFVLKRGKYIVVTDYRAIKEQPSGSLYLKQIPAYQFAVKDGELILEKQVTVSDEDFIANFTDSLDNESMELVKRAISVGAVEKEKASIDLGKSTKDESQ